MGELNYNEFLTALREAVENSARAIVEQRINAGQGGEYTLIANQAWWEVKELFEKATHG